MSLCLISSSYRSSGPGRSLDFCTHIHMSPKCCCTPGFPSRTCSERCAHIRSRLNGKKIIFQRYIHLHINEQPKYTRTHVPTNKLNKNANSLTHTAWQPVRPRLETHGTQTAKTAVVVQTHFRLFLTDMHRFAFVDVQAASSICSPIPLVACKRTA